MNLWRSVLLYSAFRQYADDTQRSADANGSEAGGDDLVSPGCPLFACLAFDIPWALVIFLSCFAYWPVAVIFTIPFVAFNAAIIYRLCGGGQKS